MKINTISSSGAVFTAVAGDFFCALSECVVAICTGKAKSCIVSYISQDKQPTVFRVLNVCQKWEQRAQLIDNSWWRATEQFTMQAEKIHENEPIWSSLSSSVVVVTPSYAHRTAQHTHNNYIQSSHRMPQSYMSFPNRVRSVLIVPSKWCLHTNSTHVECGIIWLSLRQHVDTRMCYAL